jgi:hypothetical protein
MSVEASALPAARRPGLAKTLLIKTLVEALRQVLTHGVRVERVHAG